MCLSDQKFASILLWIVTVHLYIHTYIPTHTRKARKLSSGKNVCVCVCTSWCASLQEGRAEMLVAVSVVHRHQKSRVRNGVLNDFGPEGNRQDSVLNYNTRAATGRGWWFCLKEKGSPP